MLEQASGVELGMTAAQVRKARANAVVDENGMWESLDRFRSTAFVFDTGSIWRGSHRSIQAVIVDQLIPVADTSQRLRAVGSIGAVWNRVAGPPTDSLEFWSPSFSPEQRSRTRLVFWCRPDALLLLIYDPGPGVRRDRYSLVRAVVQTPDFELASGYRIPYSDVNCSSQTRVTGQPPPARS
jgi:hypothetical protein